MLVEILKQIADEKKSQNYPNSVVINSLKEYLQFPVLNFIYNSDKYSKFIFTGGSCLQICYGLPRLSEDLDFDLEKKDYQKLDLEKMGAEITEYFKKRFLFDIKYKVQGNTRLYLKFDVLKKLGLLYGEGSGLLYVKIEPALTMFDKFQEEPIPISNYGFNFVARSYTLSFLMASKIIAILERQWFKGEENEVNIKGRDFYDLYWYLEKNVKPDMGALKALLGISSEKELKKKLWEKIEKDVDEKKLAYDLQNFFSEQNYITDFCKNYKKIIKKYLQ